MTIVIFNLFHFIIDTGRYTRNIFYSILNINIFNRRKNIFSAFVVNVILHYQSHFSFLYEEKYVAGGFI